MVTTTIPECSKIQPAHLSRVAYVYVRQSSPYQVANNKESGFRQYNLVESLVTLGWPRDRVVVVDDDQGRSSSTPGSRGGFQEMAKAVARSEVGVVMALEASRLARNNPDWHSLVYVCRLCNTLIADETGVYDPSRSTDRMVLGIRGALSELELDTSIHRMMEARKTKAERGELRWILPAGYEYDALGRVAITSDEAVANAVRLVFSKFDELGSALQVFSWWKKQELTFPVRRKDLHNAPVVWVVVQPDQVLRMLRHPVYAGAYAYGRTETVREVDAAGPLQVKLRRRKRAQYKVLILDHHPGYITYERHEQIMERLQTNNPVPDERGAGGPVREGRGLLQGLARCGRCGRAMYVQYAGRSRKWSKGTLTYTCHSAAPEGGESLCQIVGGQRVDDAVVAAFLETVAPAAAEVATAATERIRREREEAERTWKLLIEKAEYEAQRAERQYNAVEPENRVVVRELERRWEAQLVEVEALRKKASMALAQLLPLSDSEIAQAQRLAQDLPAVWNAPTTTPRDRKRLLRCVIEEVQLCTEEKRYLIRIVWKGGATSHLEVRRLPRGSGHATPEETVDLVRRLATEFDDEQVMHILNKQGRRSGYGRGFTKEAVRSIRRQHGIPSCPKPVAKSPEEGPFTADEAAAELGVSGHTIHRWLREGVLAGKQATPCAPWRIMLTEDVRRRLTVGDAPPGWVALTTAARRLGLSKPHVAHLVKSGKLPAVRTRVRGRECWRIRVSTEDCGKQGGLFDQMINDEGKEA